MIPKEFITSLVERCDIEDVIGSYVSLKRAGRNLKGLCPFHSEHTPSFVVYRDTQSYFCFGCGAGGDVINFIKQAENLEYTEAIRLLANRMGVEVPEDGQTDETTRLKSRIYEMNRDAARFFHKCLYSEAGKEGLLYFSQKRQLSKETISKYGLGFAPDSWNALTDYLKHKGYSEYELLSAALVAKGRNGSVYDQFRNRVMFPIIDLRGNVIGFGGRVLDDSKPKYLNSSDTLVFKKSRNLFSLNFAKNEIKDKLILAEGYMDVIAIYAAGFHNVVATLGTALTEEQARLMSKYAKEIVISYDSDEAGQKATHRAINLLGEAGLSAKVLNMNGAKDPDEYIKKFGTKRFELLIDGASGVIDHELNAIKKANDLELENGKIEYVKAAVQILADITDRITREVYAAKVAKDAGIQPEAVTARVNVLIKKKNATREKREWNDIQTNKDALKDRLNPQKAQNLREAGAEEGIIAFLFKNPDYYDYLLTKIEIEDFVTSYNKKVLEAMIQTHSKQEEVSLTALSLLLSPEECKGVAGILARNSAITASKDNLDIYIDILIEHKNRISPQKAKEFSSEDLEQYRKMLAQKKK